LLEESSRYLFVDQDRGPDQQHVHVRTKLVVCLVSVARTQALADRLGYLARRAGGLDQDDGCLRRYGAGSVVELPEPDHLVHHQQCDQQHEQARHRIGGERVTGPPPAHRPFGDLQEDQHGGEQRGGDRRKPAPPA
jgi:hypothetical protein